MSETHRNIITCPTGLQGPARRIIESMTDEPYEYYHWTKLRAGEGPMSIFDALDLMREQFASTRLESGGPCIFIADVDVREYCDRLALAACRQKPTRPDCLRRA